SRVPGSRSSRAGAAEYAALDPAIAPKCSGVSHPELDSAGASGSASTRRPGVPRWRGRRSHAGGGSPVGGPDSPRRPGRSRVSGSWPPPAGAAGCAALGAAIVTECARDGGHQLLLPVLRVTALVVGARERRIVDEHPAPARPDVVAEVVADKGFGPAGPSRVRGVELGVPGVRRQPDVVSLWGEHGVVELDAGVDTVVPRAVGGQASAVVWVHLVQ